MKKILITGGAGFIGSHVVRRFVRSGLYSVINLDKLTYAGNLENLTDVEKHPNYHFVKGDICDFDFVKRLFEEHNFDGVVHLAAESHVDRSITNPMAFIGYLFPKINGSEEPWDRLLPIRYLFYFTITF